MTKKDARTLLKNFCKEKIENGQELPIYDEVVTREFSEGCINTWTFRGLLQFIYQLEDKQ